MVSRSDARRDQHKSGSCKGLTGAEHCTCLSAGIRSLRSKNQHTDTAAPLDPQAVAMLRRGVG